MFLVVTGLLLLCRPVEAQTAGELLAKCIRHYAMADFSTSLKHCQQATGLTKAPKLLARIHLYIGLNQMGQKKKALARKAFVRALTHNPGLTVNARRHKKAVVALFARVKKSTVGQLSVKADRPGALVFVDGKQVGTVPYSGSFPVGKRWLVVRTPDNRYLHEVEVTIVPGNNQLVLSLKVVHGYLTVQSEPAGADVMVNGQEVGQTPLSRHHLRPGLYKIALTKEGHARVERSVNVQLDRESKLSVPLPTEGGEPAPVPVPVVAPVPDDPPARSFWKRKRIWTWVAAGTAVVAAGVGMGLGLSALSDHEEYMDTDDPKRFDDLEQSIPDKITTANIMFGIAGAAGAAAVVLLFLEGRPSLQDYDKDSAFNGLRVVPVVGSTSGVMLEARF